MYPQILEKVSYLADLLMQASDTSHELLLTFGVTKDFGAIARHAHGFYLEAS